MDLIVESRHPCRLKYTIQKVPWLLNGMKSAHRLCLNCIIFQAHDKNSRRIDQKTQTLSRPIVIFTPQCDLKPTTSDSLLRV